MLIDANRSRQSLNYIGSRDLRMTLEDVHDPPSLRQCHMQPIDSPIDHVRHIQPQQYPAYSVTVSLRGIRIS
jgi:hypothetical protein